MQIPSVASQLQAQLINSGKAPAQTPKPQVAAPKDADGDTDGDIAASDKGKGLDTKG